MIFNQTKLYDERLFSNTWMVRCVFVSMLFEASWDGIVMREDIQGLVRSGMPEDFFESSINCLIRSGIIVKLLSGDGYYIPSFESWFE